MPNTIVRNMNALGVAGITFILAMGLFIQVTYGELPCPLCLLQRVGFALVLYGFMLNVVQGLRFRHYGIIIFGALFGAAVALRQISLHIIPGTGTYGPPILGLHLYTWAFVLFSATLLAAGIVLVVSRDGPTEAPVVLTRFERIVCWSATVIVAVNVVATFLQCGPLVCDDDPVSYKLLTQIIGSE
jgi:disulfide bond formation protein DsbB